MPAGRPTLYNDLMPEKAYRLALLGLTDVQMAAALEIDETTLEVWKNEYPEFKGSLQEGKESADARVAESLYKRAIGYEHETVKIYQYEGQPVIVPYTEKFAPDTQAASLWLRNRQPKKWRDKTDVENRTTINLADPIVELLKQIAEQGTKIYDPKPE